MKTLKLNRKGVSPIIATLLLIVIAVAAAVVTYGFVMGFLGTSTTTPVNIQSRITVEAVSLNSTQSPFKVNSIVVRNVGTSTVNVTAAYLYTSDGVIFRDGVNASISLEIPAGSSEVLYNPLANYSTADGYVGYTVTKTTNFYVKVGTSDGVTATSEQFTIKK